jgi:hypothetical protein
MYFTTLSETATSKTSIVESTKAQTNARSTMKTTMPSNNLELAPKGSKEATNHPLFRNEDFIVAGSASIVGLILVFFLVGLLMAKCKKS